MPTPQHIHSEEVEEIITAVPPWLLRWGLTVFFMVLVSLVIFSALIKTPDKITGKLRIESVNKPEEIVPLVQAKLSTLFVKENMWVDSGSVLGYLESNAKPIEVLHISRVTDEIQNLAIKKQTESLDTLFLTNYNHLGELQNSFLAFSESFIQFKTFLANGIYHQKETSIQLQLNDLVLQKKRLYNQLKIYEQDYEIATKEFEAFKKLLAGKVVSPLEFKREESKYLNKSIPIENTQSALLGNTSSQNIKRQELADIASQITAQKTGFLAKLNQFKSEVDNWKRNYILTANTGGKVIFNKFIKQGDYIEANKPLFYIDNEKGGAFEGQMSIGQTALGKVQEGQQVIIRLSAYPYQEYGILKGKISYLSNQTVSDSVYIAKILISNQNQTSYHKKINLKNGLFAEAEIITRNRSLLTKLFDSLYSLFNSPYA
jgi:HlyD family secretion protein